MGFLKKNWLNLTLAILSIVGAIFVVVVLSDAPSGIPFMATAGTLSWLVFFGGMAAFFLLRMFISKNFIPALVLLITGAVVTVLSFMFMIEVSGTHRFFTLPTFFPLFAIGLFPLFFGIGMLLKKNEK